MHSWANAKIVNKITLNKWAGTFIRIIVAITSIIKQIIRLYKIKLKRNIKGISTFKNKAGNMIIIRARNFLIKYNKSVENQLSSYLQGHSPRVLQCVKNSYHPSKSLKNSNSQITIIIIRKNK